MDVINSIVSRVSNEDEPGKKLSFKHMRQTTSPSEGNNLPGIRKLG
jgi:hypothetical protein